MNALAVSVVLLLSDEAPRPEDVKAGWTAFMVFIGLILAVAFLGWSLVRQLRKAQKGPGRRRVRRRAGSSRG